jgi:kindlin 2
MSIFQYQCLHLFVNFAKILVNSLFSIDMKKKVNSFLLTPVGIRHAEELSLLHTPKSTISTNTNERRTSPRRRRHNIGTLNRHNSMGDSLANNTSTISTLFSPTTPKLRSTAAIDTISHQQRSTSNLSKSLNSLVISTDNNLARTPIKTYLAQLIKPINILEKSKLNGLWLNSSKSLMEQNSNENDFILLRFKYFTFYDLNPKV